MYDNYAIIDNSGIVRDGFRDVWTAKDAYFELYYDGFYFKGDVYIVKIVLAYGR